jgi:hypothetical protein
MTLGTIPNPYENVGAHGYRVQHNELRRFGAFVVVKPYGGGVTRANARLGVDEKGEHFDVITKSEHSISRMQWKWQLLESFRTAGEACAFARELEERRAARAAKEDAALTAATEKNRKEAAAKQEQQARSERARNVDKARALLAAEKKRLDAEQKRLDAETARLLELELARRLVDEWEAEESARAARAPVV